MEEQFKEAEKSFAQLKKKFRQGKISRREFIDRLKNLRLKDGDGRFWMIGVKSGKWYYLDGKEWVQSEPPSIMDGKAICIYCGFENKLDTEVCARCGGEMEEKEAFERELDDKFTEATQDLTYFRDEDEKGRKEEKDDSYIEDEKWANFVFRSISPISFLAFWGTIGLLLGIVLGAFAGASNYFFGIVNIMPGFLKSIQGNLLGGIIYAGLGGALGFALFGLIGFFEAFIINVISSFIGGIKIHIEKRGEE